MIDDESDNTEQDSGTSDQAVSQGEERTGCVASGWSLVRESGEEIQSESRMREIRTSGCVSSKGWHVQWEKKTHRGKGQKPRNLDSKEEGN